MARATGRLGATTERRATYCTGAGRGAADAQRLLQQRNRAQAGYLRRDRESPQKTHLQQARDQIAVRVVFHLSASAERLTPPLSSTASVLAFAQLRGTYPQALFEGRRHVRLRVETAGE